MNPHWDAPALAEVTVSPRELAAEICRGLGEASSSVITVVELHLEALDGALTLPAPEVLADQLRWQDVRLRAAHAPFSGPELDRAVSQVLDTRLSTVARQHVRELYDVAEGLARTLEAHGDSAIQLPPGQARDYLVATMAGERDAAVAVVREAMSQHLDVADIMLGILQPAQEELGRLWEHGEVSIAQEHYTTAITQLCLSLLYPQVLMTRNELGFRLVAASVGAESHEIGIRMISDLFEQGGWRSTYLGADLPDRDIIDFAVMQRADVVAVSATMSGHVSSVRRLITGLRADPRAHGIRVLVGGRPFTRNPRLVELVGADGSAPSAREALELCQSWMERRATAL